MSSFRAAVCGDEFSRECFRNWGRRWIVGNRAQLQVNREEWAWLHIPSVDSVCYEMFTETISFQILVVGISNLEHNFVVISFSRFSIPLESCRFDSIVWSRVRARNRLILHGFAFAQEASTCI